MKKFISLAIIGLLLGISAIPAAYAQGKLATVENFKAEKTGNRSVTLKWNAVPQATGYTVLYGTSSVTTQDQEYNRPPIVTENVTQYTVDNLTNGTKYYFNIFATNNTDTSATLSTEVNATPTAAGTNAAPTIAKVETVSSTQFKLVFSKDMTFPANLATQITVVKGFDETPLKVVSATAENATTLNVVTAAQSAGAEYRLSLSDKFTDKAGVVVAPAERQDTFLGKGQDIMSELLGSADEVSADLSIVSATVAPDSKAVELVFSKSVVLEETPKNQFAIVETDSPADSSLVIQQVLPNAQDDKKVLVVVEGFKPVSYTLLALRVKDKDGNLISEENSTVEFNGSPEGGSEAATGEVDSLEAQFVDVAKLLAQVTWGVNPDIDAATLKGFRIYLAEGSNGAFNLLSDVDATSTQFDTESLNPADLYTFKVTTLNADGTESEGAIAELVLPGTGPAGLILLAFGSLSLGRFATRRKN